MTKLFVYGTLQRNEVAQAILKRTPVFTLDKLHDYKLDEITINGTVYPLAVISKGSFVRGEIFEVSDEELKKLDDYETAAYARKKVRLESGESAWVYCKPELNPNLVS